VRVCSKVRLTRVAVRRTNLLTYLLCRLTLPVAGDRASSDESWHQRRRICEADDSNDSSWCTWDDAEQMTRYTIHLNDNSNWQFQRQWSNTTKHVALRLQSCCWSSRPFGYCLSTRILLVVCVQLWTKSSWIQSSNPDSKCPVYTKRLWGIAVRWINSKV